MARGLCLWVVVPCSLLMAWAAADSNASPRMESQPPSSQTKNYGAPAKRDKTVWNYDGGLVMMTDGSIPNGPCFRVSGKITAPNFFDGLKRTDTDTGPLFHRKNDLVTQFPAQMELTFEMYDLPCIDGVQPTGSHTYLNRALMQSLRVLFFWKRGVELRRITGVVPKHFEARLIPPYGNVKDVPEKYEWWFEYEVPSAGVPVTDSLVVVLLTPDNHIAARVALRM